MVEDHAESPAGVCVSERRKGERQVGEGFSRLAGRTVGLAFTGCETMKGFMPPIHVSLESGFPEGRTSSGIGMRRPAGGRTCPRKPGDLRLPTLQVVETCFAPPGSRPGIMPQRRMTPSGQSFTREAAASSPHPVRCRASLRHPARRPVTRRRASTPHRSYPSRTRPLVRHGMRCGACFGPRFCRA